MVSQIFNAMLQVIVQTKTKWLGDTYSGSIHKIVDSKNVRGVMFFDWVLRLRPDKTWGLEGFLHWLPIIVDDVNAFQESELFYANFRQGLPNVTHF
jgi:hypothetical protein